MANTSQMTEKHLFQLIGMNIEWNVIENIPEGLIDYVSSLVQAVAGNRAGVKPVLEPVMTKICDALELPVLRKAINSLW